MRIHREYLLRQCLKVKDAVCPQVFMQVPGIYVEKLLRKAFNIRQSGNVIEISIDSML